MFCWGTFFLFCPLLTTKFFFYILYKFKLKKNLLEESFEHVVGDLLGPGSVDLVDLLGVRVVSVKSPELTLDVAEQQQEVRTIAPVDNILNKRNGLIHIFLLKVL
jgi:hypothetical protein